MATFSSKLFHFDKETKVLSQEISVLSASEGGQVFEQIYSDACDEGIKILSAETGVVIGFAVDKIDYSGFGEDREIAGWNLIPTAESIRKAPAELRARIKALRVLIIND